MKFLLALLVAAYAEARRSPRTLLRAPWGIVKALWGFATDADKRVPLDVRMKRMRYCERCPIYFAPRQTCGNPIGPDADMGCGCWMPLKSAVESNCWLYDKTGGCAEAWPQEINSFPYNEPSRKS